MISRAEQQSLILQFERDYGLLVMQTNKDSKCTKKNKLKAIALAEEIKKAAKPYLFEEDFLDFLHDMSKSIKNYAAMR